MKNVLALSVFVLTIVLSALPTQARETGGFYFDPLVEKQDSVSIRDSLYIDKDELYYLRLVKTRHNNGNWNRITGLMTFDPEGEAVLDIGERQIYVFFDVSSKELIEEEPELYDYYGTFFSEGTAQPCVVIWGHTDHNSYLKVFWEDEDENETILEFTAEDIY